MQRCEASDIELGQNPPRMESTSSSGPARASSLVGPVRRHVPKSNDLEDCSTRFIDHHDDANGKPSMQALAQTLDAEHKRQSLRFCVVTVLGLICLGMTMTCLLLFRSHDEFPPLPAQLSQTHSLSVRLLPGVDVISGLMDVVLSRGIRSASVASAVGSLTQYNIRFADQNTSVTATGHFEVVSLVGTMTSINTTGAVGQSGAWHLHISIGNEQGTTISGHLMRNSTIFTTLEVVILYNCAVEYFRADDGTTGYDELQIRNATWC